jgi:hypothetical protein
MQRLKIRIYAESATHTGIASIELCGPAAVGNFSRTIATEHIYDKCTGISRLSIGSTESYSKRSSLVHSFRDYVIRLIANLSK